MVGGPSARVRVAVSAACALATAVVVLVLGPWWLVPTAAWIVGAGVFLVWDWTSIGPLDAEATAARAGWEAPGRRAVELLLLTASVVSLIAVGLLLVRAGSSRGAAKGLLVGAGVLSVVLAWAVVHTVFTLRYASLYYRGDPGGIDFNQHESPCYRDFAYLGFTVGMTFQVSDTQIGDPEIRASVLRHALLSYLFGSVIVATTINLVAGLG